jgi:hypothetical protein
VVMARAGGRRPALDNGSRARCFHAAATTIGAARATTGSMRWEDGPTSSAVCAASHTTAVRATTAVGAASAASRAATARGPYSGATVVGALVLR